MQGPCFVFNPRLPEVFRVTLIPEVGYIIPQSNFVNYVAPRIEKANFPLVLYVFEVEESISDIFTELPCSRDLDILGQHPVLLPIFALIADTVALVAFISAISTFFMFSRSRNPFLAVSRSYVPCLSDLENPGQLPVLQVLKGTDDWVLWILEISSFSTFSRSRNLFLAVSRSYHVWVTSKIQVNFRFYRSSRVLMIGSYGF